MMRRRLLLVVLVAAGVLVTVGVPTAWLVTRGTDTVGADVAGALAGETPGPTGPSTSGPTPPGPTTAAPQPSVTSAAPAPVPAVPDVPVQDGRVGAGSRRSAEVTPAEVRIPSLGVNSRVVPIGVDRAGELEIPEDVRTVGWYRFGPRPGDRQGSVVMSGHLDSAEQGKGSFFRLGELGPGDTVLVRMSSGRLWRYRVVAREAWPKPVVPLDRIFSRSGAPRLTLVTCGGGFREDVRSYEDNIAVTAVPEEEVA